MHFVLLTDSAKCAKMIYTDTKVSDSGEREIIKEFKKRGMLFRCDGKYNATKLNQ